MRIFRIDMATRLSVKRIHRGRYKIGDYWILQQSRRRWVVVYEFPNNSIPADMTYIDVMRSYREARDVAFHEAESDAKKEMQT
ncbi:hypothetical protein AFE_1119 [Acidithiobacillus ferrooxidans ATCC 23270]|uniref:Uncharacterized protein n=1 Tax=Acidithiobacillus ferrooxidans (strain ATCC 23270 / DSM 14882 / CIP 104768 / NCIMB 8455) TaxID=243159 RepID=B7J867_ACIF2|nr:hypothetical protein AFE_1119 [Acidithiobacillus ferrooxidans ATCC 23270]